MESASRYRSVRFRVASCIACLAVLLVTTIISHPAQAEPYESVVTAGGNDYGVKTGNFGDRRFDNVVRQRYDFSCGSAALATLLSYGYDLPVDEMTVLNAMYEQGDKVKIHKEGFSLLDMKRYLHSIGLKADGYRQSLDKLARVGVPALVLINRSGYMHFVVIQGVTKTKVLIADPASGLHVSNRHEFEKMWNGILFVVLDMNPLGRRYFNTPTVWAKRKQTIDTTELVAGGDIASFTLTINPNPNYY